jgi:hypothetical protein
LLNWTIIDCVTYSILWEILNNFKWDMTYCRNRRFRVDICAEGTRKYMHE